MDSCRSTCVGVVKPELYSQSLRSLCSSNDRNMSRLKSEMDTLSIVRKASEEREDNFYSPCFKRNKRNSVYTNSSIAISDASDMSECDSSISSKTLQTTFCYLCSTMEEHLNHHVKKTAPRKPTKPRIVYIAPPPPQARRKKDARPSVIAKDALYRVEVFTADKQNASTDANVFITIKGNEDTLPKTQLKKNTGCARFIFDRASREKFYIKGPKLGNLETLTIEHDGHLEKHSWCLDRVEVTDMATKDSWIFVCNKWLSLHIKDFKIKRRLKASPKEVELSEYKITVHTGKKAFAGTDANVFITLFGEERSSPKILLKDPTQKCFERSRVDSFQVRLTDLGNLKKIRIEHDGKGLAPGWFLDHVVIYKIASPSHKFYFYCNSWLSRDEGGGRLWKELPARTKPRHNGHRDNGNKLKYVVTVHTGDVKYGGTDANVFIQMIGPNGVTNEIPLDDAKNNFERNMVDVFTFEADDVGCLEKILIGHDNSGVGAGWFLDRVIVRRYLPKTEHKREEVSERSKTGQKLIRRLQTERKKELQELENSEFLGIIERQFLSELQAEAELIRRQKWAVVPEVRYGSDIEYSEESSDEERGERRGYRDRVRAERSKYSRGRDRAVSLSVDRKDRRRSSDRNRRRRSMMRSETKSDSEIDSETEAESKTESKRRDSRVDKEKLPLFEEYTFVCRQWLSTDEGDRQIVRELPCVDKTERFEE